MAQPMYSFSLDEKLAVEVGDAVVVQFGSSRYYTGIVWSISTERPDYPRLKPILKKLYSRPLLTPATQRLWEWIADYYMATLGEVMRLALPSLAKPSATSLGELDERSIEPPTEEFIALSNELQTEEQLLAYREKHARRAPRRVETIERIASLAIERNAEDGFIPRRLVDLDSQHLAALRTKGLIRNQRRPRERLAPDTESNFLLPTLTPHQQQALEAIRLAHDSGKVALLHGVTGSGKTEIYIHLIAEQLAAGNDVMVLVPEIVITSQLIERLERIFEGRTTTYHSRLTPLRRGREFLRLAASSGGELIVGVRSTIFLPMQRPGLIIVDEEHDAGYKQSDYQPRYNARDCAVVMSRIYGTKVLLGSATPSLESYTNALAGKYGYAELKERWGKGVLPEIVISDTLRALKRGERRTHFNLDLIKRINEALEQNEQVILFQNRRGYAPYLQCRTCGYSPRCPHCNVTLTQHKSSSRLECHYCGYTTESSNVCPNCQTQDMKAMGFGTEKVEEEVSRMFPAARITRLDGDTSQSERSFKRIVTSFEQHECDILVGTQIVSKGFDFEGVSTVGILNADNLLSAPDFRATERSFQLLTQVAGRAGRHNNRGRVVIQTSQPEHPVIRYVVSADYHGMARTELAERRAFGYPPYSHLIRFMLRHSDYELLRLAAHTIARELRSRFAHRVMGPVSSTLEMLRGEHRAEILLKIESGASMKAAREKIKEVLHVARNDKKIKSVTISTDVDTW